MYKINNLGDDMNLKFCFKGKRTYVHGTDTYDKLIELLSDKFLDGKFDLSFHGVAKKNIVLVTEKPKDENRLKFVCRCTDLDGNKNILFGLENNVDIECRYEYPEEDIYALSTLDLKNKTAGLIKNSSYSFIENTVAMNKYLLENLFPKADGKWYFTRLQLKSIPNDEQYPLKLELKANFNFKLTKTEIFINNKSIGFIYFSLV